LNAFISCFVEWRRFYFVEWLNGRTVEPAKQFTNSTLQQITLFISRWSLNRKKPFAGKIIFPRTKLKDQQMKKMFVTLAIASLFLVSKSSAVSLNDIRVWAGSGTNRAALVVEWSTPESSVYSTVPAPIADKTFVWGYRFNGAPTASQMLAAIVASDPRIYVVADESSGTFVESIGYNLNGDGGIGITDGTTTNYFTNAILTDATVDVDAAAPLNTNDLFWSGDFGPNWESWNELGDNGGFLNAPDRGANPYWTPDPENPFSGVHGQWEYAQWGLDSLMLTNGSWIGFSVAAGEYEGDPSAPYNTHKHAPSLPDVSFAGTVPPAIQNFTGAFSNGVWQVQFISQTNWLYTLQRSADLQTWTCVSNAISISGNGTNLFLQDTNAISEKSFYRVRADLP
jgi:hypothetical protein